HAAPTRSFDGSGSTDPEVRPLTSPRDLNGDGVFGDATSPTTTFTYTADGTYTAALQVTDDQGASDTATVVITVGNTPPVTVIDTPSASLTWRVGDPIAFSGHATDTQDGTLPAAALTWSVIMHHCVSPSDCHTHLIQTFNGVSSGTFTAPDHQYPCWLEFQLTATDSGGLTATASLRLDPRTVLLTFRTSPS